MEFVDIYDDLGHIQAGETSISVFLPRVWWD